MKHSIYLFIYFYLTVYGTLKPFLVSFFSYNCSTSKNTLQKNTNNNNNTYNHFGKPRVLRRHTVLLMIQVQAHRCQGMADLDLHTACRCVLSLQDTRHFALAVGHWNATRRFCCSTHIVLLSKNSWCWSNFELVHTWPHKNPGFFPRVQWSCDLSARAQVLLLMSGMCHAQRSFPNRVCPGKDK